MQAHVVAWVADPSWWDDEVLQEARGDHIYTNYNILLPCTYVVLCTTNHKKRQSK